MPGAVGAIQLFVPNTAVGMHARDLSFLFPRKQERSQPGNGLAQCREQDEAHPHEQACSMGHVRRSTFSMRWLVSSSVRKPLNRNARGDQETSITSPRHSSCRQPPGNLSARPSAHQHMVEATTLPALPRSNMIATSRFWPL